MSFLKAEWRKLALANYKINPAVLSEFVPKGTEIDLWNDKCYLSLVGFMFLNTKVLGMKIPFHVNFEEVNLRFYVKRKEGNDWKRGVVFVKEIVPRQALALVANTLYKEHYEATPMKHQWNELGEKLEVEYSWKAAHRWQNFKVIAAQKPEEILPESEAEFITEHYWGYTKVNDNKTFQYEVTHPKWQQYRVLDHEIDVNFEMSYGKRFSFLNDQKPTSVMLAEGSVIRVENKSTLR